MSSPEHPYGDGDRTTTYAAPRQQHPAHMAPPPPYGYGGWGGGYGPGFGFRRPPMPVETKPFFLTSEFFGVLLLIAAMAIGAASHEDFDSRMFWILTSGVVSAYVISRGIAKSGTKSRAYDPRDDIDFGRREGGRDND